MVSLEGYFIEEIAKKARLDTRPIPVADGWAGAEMRVFPLFDSCSQTDQRTDGQSLLQSCVFATKNK